MLANVNDRDESVESSRLIGVMIYRKVNAYSVHIATVPRIVSSYKCGITVSVINTIRLLLYFNRIGSTTELISNNFQMYFDRGIPHTINSSYHNPKL